MTAVKAMLHARQNKVPRVEHLCGRTDYIRTALFIVTKFLADQYLTVSNQTGICPIYGSTTPL